jgi:hypothetical protein
MEEHAVFQIFQATARRIAASVVVLIALSLSSAAKAEGSAYDPPPSTGTGFIVSGWILTGVGALNLASLPICKADFYPADAEDTCVAASLVVGIGGLGLGIPFLIVGYNRRSDYHEWRRRHPLLRSLIETNVQLGKNSVSLNYRLEL